MPAHCTSPRRRPALTIRHAEAGDTPTIRRLAALDSQPQLTGPALIAEIGDEAWAAVELNSGRTIADPFRPSEQIAAIARARATVLRLAA